jgi:hypothetical protein
MLRGQEKADSRQGFCDSVSQGKTSKPETELKMEIVKFLLEFTAVTVVISAVASLTIISRFASGKRLDTGE